MPVKITSDNCCDLPKELLQHYNVEIIPLQVRFGDKEYAHGELTNAQFYQMMQSSTILPSTSQPSVGDFQNLFKDQLRDNEEIISIHLSSGISGTVQAAQMGAELVDKSRIHVFDSKKASIGEGLLVLEAARMAEKGLPASDILPRLQEMQDNMQCIFLVGNLEALIKGGRISRTKAAIAGLLDIKPILRFDEEGHIVPYDKVRGHKAAMNKLIEIISQQGKDINQQTVGVCHSACPDIAEYLSQNIKTRLGVKEVIIGEVGPVIGSHVGHGTFSVFFEK